MQNTQLYLHFTMLLLKQFKSFLDCEAKTNLHFIMFLLKPSSRFFSFASIFYLHFIMLLLKQIGKGDVTDGNLTFTFHYASIKTKMQGDDFKDVYMYLHFIMLLLNPVLLYRCYINILGQHFCPSSFYTILLLCFLHSTFLIKPIKCFDFNIVQSSVEVLYFLHYYISTSIIKNNIFCSTILPKLYELFKLISNY